MSSLFRFVRMDIKRLLKRPELYLSAGLVTVVLFWALEQRSFHEGSVIETYFYALESAEFMVTFSVCAYAYATVFCEEFESMYLRYEIIRGNLSHYLISKTLVIFLSAAVTMVMGTLFFLAICRCFTPLADAQAKYSYLLAGCFAGLFRAGHYWSYCMIAALWMGMLAGTLSVFAAWISLYFSNKVMVMAVPMLLYQILLGLPIPGYGVYSFRIYNAPFPSDWQCFGWNVLICLIPAVVIYQMMKHKIRQRI